jgi:hypothetical protein
VRTGHLVRRAVLGRGRHRARIATGGRATVRT